MDNLLKSVEFFDELSQPTQEKPETAPEVFEPVVKNDRFSQDFDEQIEDEPDEPEQHEEIEDEEPYNAEEEAEKLLGLLNAGNVLLMSPLTQIVLKKKRGGKKILERCKIAFMKVKNGEKATDGEKEMAAKYEAYQTDLQTLAGEIAFSEQELAAMRVLAVPYCRASKVKINGSLAFWLMYGGYQTQRIMKILTA
jgi:hypothetical protein